MKGVISRQDRETPKPGSYYRCIKKDDEIKAGWLVVVTNFEADEEDGSETVSYAREDNEYATNLTDFLKHYKFAPDGKAERDREMMELMSQLTGMREKETQLLQSLAQDGLPLLLEEGSSDEPVEESERSETSQALMIVSPDAIRAKQVKRSAALVKNQAIKFERKMELLSSKIQSIKAESEAYLQAFLSQTSSLQKMIAVAEEVIWTVNIYLGRGEEIVQLKEGEPAAAEEKISIRQLVLYADEEMAFKPLHGGADFKDLDQLDKWLLESDNLQQVLPETRGIIAFSPRRSDKVYDNSGTLAGEMLNARYNALNKKTYFLMRNGDNLYRVTTDIQVSGHLVPKAKEFDEIFDNTDFYSKQDGKTTKVRPGTKSFSRAMDRASDRQRHYGRIILFLQGIIDRTKIFAPLMNESLRVNLLDRKNHESYIRYIYDDENLLPTGRPSFWKWLEATNKQINTGHRIIAIFDEYKYGLKRTYKQYNYDHCDRLSPKKAGFPDNNKLYTIEGRRGNAFVIRYDREEERYDRKIWVESKTKPGWGHYGAHRKIEIRASCEIYPDDKFFIDFDAANVEDMEFYLKSRVDRIAYITMFPLLETCLKLKAKEKREEKPFIQMLTGLIMSSYGHDKEDADKLVPSLVDWWKLKNRTHRALLSDDTKAINMIVQEYGLRLRRMLSTSSITQDERAIIDHIIKFNEGTEVLYIGHRDKVYYSVYLPSNDDNLFVDEQIWVFPKRGEPHLYEPEPGKPWKTVDKRKLRWTTIYSSERWDSWRSDARREEYLSDPEIAQLMEGIWEKIKVEIDRYDRYHSREGKGAKVLWPLAISLTKKQELECWWYDKSLRFEPKKDFAKDQDRTITEPQVAHVSVPWKRVHGRVAVREFNGIGHYQSTPGGHSGFGGEVPVGPPNRPWETRAGSRVAGFTNVTITLSGEEVITDFRPGEVQPRILWTNDENIKKYEQQFENYCEAKKQMSDWGELIFPLYQANEAMMKRWEAVEYQKYLKEDGDPELWDENEIKERKKKAGVSYHGFYANTFEKAVRRAIVEGKDLVGQTVENIMDLTLFKLTDNELEYLPLDLVIQPDKSEEEVEAESSDEEEEIEFTMDTTQMWDKIEVD